MYGNYGNPLAPYPHRFLVTWDDQEHIFTSFHEARDFLATEIWWLAEDSGNDEAYKAWDKVRKWDPPTGRQTWEKMKYQVRVGKPAAIYRLIPEFL